MNQLIAAADLVLLFELFGHPVPPLLEDMESATANARDKSLVERRLRWLEEGIVVEDGDGRETLGNAYTLPLSICFHADTVLAVEDPNGVRAAIYVYANRSTTISRQANQCRLSTDAGTAEIRGGFMDILGAQPVGDSDRLECTVPLSDAERLLDWLESGQTSQIVQYCDARAWDSEAVIELLRMTDMNSVAQEDLRRVSTFRADFDGVIITSIRLADQGAWAMQWTLTDDAKMTTFVRCSNDQLFDLTVSGPRAT